MILIIYLVTIGIIKKSLQMNYQKKKLNMFDNSCKKVVDVIINETIKK